MHDIEKAPEWCYLEWLFTWSGCFCFSQACANVLEGSCVKNLDTLTCSRFDTAILNGDININSMWLNFEGTLWSDPVQPLLKSATPAQCQHARAA